MKTRKLKNPFAAGALMLATAGAAQAQVGTPLAPNDPTSSYYNVLFRNVGTTGAYINCDNGTGRCSYEVPTMVKMAILDQVKQASAITQQRYQQIIEATKYDLNELVKAVFAENGLVALANASNGGNGKNQIQPIPMQPMYEAYAAYQEKYLVVENDFAVLASFFDGQDMSIPIEDQEFIKSIPAKAPGTVEPLKNVFWAALKNINNTLCRKKFNLQYPNDTVGYGVQAITCESGERPGESAGEFKTAMANLEVKWDGMQLDRDQINQLIAKIREFRAPTPGVVQATQQLADRTRETIMAFIDIFGIKQRAENGLWKTLPDWFWGSPNGLKKAAEIKTEGQEEAYDNLITAFWARSAMRFTTGLPIGALDVQYDQTPHNWDLFKTKAEAVRQIPKEVLFNQQNINAILMATAQKYRYALNTSASKAAVIANTDSTASKTLVLGSEYNNLVDIGNSLSEVFDGTAETWKALHLVLRLMAADLYEEQVIRQTGGMAKLMKMYANRYLKVSKEKRKRYQDLAKDYENAVLGETDTLSDQDLTSDVQFQDDNSIKGSTMKLAQEITQWTAQISHARVYQIQLDIAQNKKSSVDFSKTRAKAKML